MIGGMWPCCQLTALPAWLEVFLHSTMIDGPPPAQLEANKSIAIRTLPRTRDRMMPIPGGRYQPWDQSDIVYSCLPPAGTQLGFSWHVRPCPWLMMAFQAGLANSAVLSSRVETNDGCQFLSFRLLFPSRLTLLVDDQALWCFYLL